MTGDAPTIYLIDDNMSVLKAMTRLLTVNGFSVRSFSSAASFLAAHDAGAPGCAVVDVSMPKMGGLELQEMLVAQGPPSRPIVFITGQGDIPNTVRAMKGGAVDFLMKPVDEQVLLAAVRAALAKDAAGREEHAEAADLRQRFERLTTREREVFSGVVAGWLNKQVATELGLAEKTVKAYRARVMEKMKARSLAELVRLSDRLSFARNAGRFVRPGETSLSGGHGRS